MRPWVSVERAGARQFKPCVEPSKFALRVAAIALANLERSLRPDLTRGDNGEQ
jgi:hypothetical protein